MHAPRILTAAITGLALLAPAAAAAPAHAAPAPARHTTRTDLTSALHHAAVLTARAAARSSRLTSTAWFATAGPYTTRVTTHAGVSAVLSPPTTTPLVYDTRTGLLYQRSTDPDVTLDPAEWTAVATAAGNPSATWLVWTDSGFEDPLELLLDDLDHAAATARHWSWTRSHGTTRWTLSLPGGGRATAILDPAGRLRSYTTDQVNPRTRERVRTRATLTYPATRPIPVPAPAQTLDAATWMRVSADYEQLWTWASNLAADANADSARQDRPTTLADIDHRTPASDDLLTWTRHDEWVEVAYTSPNPIGSLCITVLGGGADVVRTCPA